MTDKKFHIILEGCQRQDRRSQKELYLHMRNYGLTITNRYASNLEEAEEIAQDGFLKVFKNIGSFENRNHFKSWFRKIFVNVSIDYFRKYKLKKEPVKLVALRDFNAGTVSNKGLSDLHYGDLLTLVRTLPPAYRINFILFSIEGLKHREIAEQLGIQIGTSKSNTAKAKAFLRNKIMENQKMNQYG